uniref:Uncharacterized protein n=1 Tax=Solanum tuberosum TaxID=4113 RepID=M1DRK0_SOLTU
MAEIDNYEDSSAQTTDDVESTEENTDSGDESSSGDGRDTRDEDNDPLSLPTCAKKFSGCASIPRTCETKQNYMATLKPYTDEMKDTIIDALKANLKGVTVLTSAVENQEDEILVTVDKNEDYTTPTVDKNGAEVDVDELLPLAIVDEDLLVVDK